MKVVLKYVENNYADKISIADIADVAGFSESHFMRYFKETMGTSFVDYLNDYRLTMAARLLQSSDSSVLSISGEVGFESLSYFNRAFKKHYGNDTSAVPQGQLTPLWIVTIQYFLNKRMENNHEKKYIHKNDCPIP